MSEEKKVKEAEKLEKVTIPPPKFGLHIFTLMGTASYIANKFPAEAKAQMRAKQAAGSQAKKGGSREGKDFQKCFRESMHATKEGKYGVPAGCFRQAMISACRIVGFKMTLAKLALFVVADAEDAEDGTPLVLFSKGEPEYAEHFVKNETGVADIRARGRWVAGWEMEVKVRFDSGLFGKDDVLNLLKRVGVQVGIGAGRPDSTSSGGQGWGTFDVVEMDGQPV
jgi:hypothetical protein